MDSFLKPPHPGGIIHIGPSQGGKSICVTNLILNFINDFERIFTCSPYVHQDFYEILIECFSNFIPTDIIPTLLIKDYIDLIIGEIVNDKYFEKSQTEIEIYDSIAESKYRQESAGGIIDLDDLDKKHWMLPE